MWLLSLKLFDYKSADHCCCSRLEQVIYIRIFWLSENNFVDKSSFSTVSMDMTEGRVANAKLKLTRLRLSSFQVFQ